MDQPALSDPPAPPSRALIAELTAWAQPALSGPLAPPARALIAELTVWPNRR